MLNTRTIKRILRERKATGAFSVYEWCSTLTTEGKYWDESDFADYYITPSLKLLLFKLRNVGDATKLIGVVGLQGVGKTTALQYLAHEMNTENKDSAILIHWTSDGFGVLENDHNIQKLYELDAYAEAYEKAYSYVDLRKPLQGIHVTHNTLSAIENRQYALGNVEVMLGRATVKKLKRETVVEYLSQRKYLFIDLPDYSKKSRGDMINDLATLEAFWKKVVTSYDMGLQVMVVGVQKELLASCPHFFFGKMDIVELEPLKPQQMVEAYKQKWQGFDVVSEEALLYIAQLSRGVFRRFLKYLQRCIEQVVMDETKGYPITVETVKAAISLEQIAKDMDLELADMFPDREQRLNAVRLLSVQAEGRDEPDDHSRIIGRE